MLAHETFDPKISPLRAWVAQMELDGMKERIKEAQSLLEYSDYSISEIVYYLQYGSQSYFSSILKKFSGVTPQQFRVKLINN